MHRIHFSCLHVFVALLLVSCSGASVSDTATESGTTISKEIFGHLSDGRDVHLYTLRNAGGFTVRITNYGGIITSILAPDRNGQLGDIIVGFDSLKHYLASHPHVGPLIGRYSGYIAGGKFSIDGVAYTLETNAGDHHLHGGPKAFDKVLWAAEEASTIDGKGLRLTYRSPDGEGGYPGNLKVTVTYVLTEENALILHYEAETDKKTHVNLTNHLYFNLSAFDSADVMQHELTINAERYAVPGRGNIPTGELKRVEGSALDFISAKAIGARISELEDGYDHNYVIKPSNSDELVQAGTVYDPMSGRLMELQTTHTAVEFASADWLDVQGRGGNVYGKRAAFLFYPQHLPDSPNRPEFPSTLLEPGVRYSAKTVYTFYTR